MIADLQKALSPRNISGRSALLLSVIVATALATGCQSTAPVSTDQRIENASNGAKPPEALVLHEGDDLKISFPGAPNLDTTQHVRPDGRITMPLGGELVAAGLTPADLEKKILELYSSQLVSKEVSVTVLSSSFTVFVTGAVLHPGKIVSDHPMSALEAVMEAGGFDNTKADMQAVRIIRNQDGGTKSFTLNLKLALEGGQSEPFYLKRSDIVYVPEKFSWF